MNPIFKKTISVVHRKGCEYPSNTDPDRNYPELSGSDIGLNPHNQVYPLVREALHQLGLDSENYDTASWNPFKDVVKKGDHVVIKPNLVKHSHPSGKKGILSMITHASVIRPVIDYILIAAKGSCKITICDVPLQTADWSVMTKITGLNDLVSHYKSKEVDIALLDLRYEISQTNEHHVIVDRSKKTRDPLGYTPVDLGKKSEFIDIVKHSEKLSITGYGVQTDESDNPSTHHNKKKNEYLIPSTILDADVFINVPKLKTHKKTGMTCAMKNLIGINGDKSWIAHHRLGGVRSGGDEFPKYKVFEHTKNKVFSSLKDHKYGKYVATGLAKVYIPLRYGSRSKLAKRNLNPPNVEINEGSWYGNDTLWRSIKDLNKIIFYADKNGQMQNKVQRKYLCIVDAVISGEGEGPMNQIPKKTGIVLAGFNPVYLDYFCAKYIMGFKWKPIKSISESFMNRWWNLVYSEKDRDELDIISSLELSDLNLHFKAPFNWRRVL